MSATILIGKTVTAVYLADDKLAIKFDVDGGEPIIARCDTDCCSFTWIEHIENPEVLIGTPVLEVEDLRLREDEETEDGAIQFYGLKLRTVNGACVLDYRNESNGYYGGSLAWPDDYHGGGVYDQAISTLSWKKVAS